MVAWLALELQNFGELRAKDGMMERLNQHGSRSRTEIEFGD